MGMKISPGAHLCRIRDLDGREWKIGNVARLDSPSDIFGFADARVMREGTQLEFVPTTKIIQPDGSRSDFKKIFDTLLKLSQNFQMLVPVQKNPFIAFAFHQTFPAVAVFLFFLILPARADDYIWIGPVNSLPPYTTTQSWFNTNYWSPNGVPGATDGAVINSRTVQLNNSVLVNSILLNTSTLQGPGPLTVNDMVVSGTNAFVDASALNFTNYPNGDFRYELLKTASFRGKSATNVKWENRGIVTLSNMWFLARGSMYTNTNNIYNVRWMNKMGSSMVLASSNYFTFENKINSPHTVFVNELGASMHKPNTNAARIDWPLRNEGTINVQAGNLGFTYAQLLNGPINVALGASVNFENSGENLEIGPGATFEGSGIFGFYGDNNSTNLVLSSILVNALARMTNVNWVGAGALFTRPIFAKGVNWKMPAQFLMGGTADGTTTSSLLNAGVFVDAGINCVPGASIVNFPPGYYYTSNSFPFGNYQGTNEGLYGWFTNSFGATVHFPVVSPSPTSMRWNFYNNGLLRFDPNVQANFLGTWAQGPFGITELSGNGIEASARYNLEGRVNGWGSITSHNARVSCVLSPHGSNSPFGKISLTTENSFTTPFPTNTFVMTSDTVLELDFGTPGTTNDYIYVSGQNQSLAGKVNIRALDGFGPGIYPIFNDATANLRFGSVPPGYRFSFVTNMSTFQLSVQVTLPELPVASLQTTNYNGGTNGFQLILNTLSNANYSVDYADPPLLTPWQPWTNVIGDGGAIALPVDTSLPARIFRIIENP